MNQATNQDIIIAANNTTNSFSLHSIFYRLLHASDKELMILAVTKRHHSAACFSIMSKITRDSKINIRKVIHQVLNLLVVWPFLRSNVEIMKKVLNGLDPNLAEFLPK